MNSLRTRGARLCSRLRLHCARSRLLRRSLLVCVLRSGGLGSVLLYGSLGSRIRFLSSGLLGDRGRGGGRHVLLRLLGHYLRVFCISLRRFSLGRNGRLLGERILGGAVIVAQKDTVKDNGRTSLVTSLFGFGGSLTLPEGPTGVE